MIELALWKRQQVRELRDDLDRLFAEFARDFGGALFTEVSGEPPFLEISETRQELIISAHIPDLGPDDIQLAVSADYLLVEGRKRERVRSENGEISRYRRFSNKIKLPCQIKSAGVKAQWKEDRLLVILPKRQETEFRKVEIERVK